MFKMLNDSLLGLLGCLHTDVVFRCISMYRCNSMYFECDPSGNWLHLALAISCRSWSALLAAFRRNFNLRSKTKLLSASCALAPRRMLWHDVTTIWKIWKKGTGNEMISEMKNDAGKLGKLRNKNDESKCLTLKKRTVLLGSMSWHGNKNDIYIVDIRLLKSFNYPCRRHGTWQMCV